jgi:succinylglutamate desuccinylase
MTVTFNSDVRAHLDRLLGQFEQAAQPGPFDYRWCHHADGGRHPLHVVFGIMVHGNEFGSLPAAVRMVQALQSGEVKFGGRVSIFVGNPEAARENQRYLEADLNRVFLDTGHDRHEDRRAQQIIPILDAADILIDFHQTILETTCPFYIFPWHRTGWQWARAIRSTNVWVTRNPKQGFSAGSKCTDEYVTDRGQPGMTVELSQKGFSEDAEQLCSNTMIETLRVADEVGMGNSIAELAQQKSELSFFETTFAERFDDPAKALVPGLVNFQAVTAGQKLQVPGSPDITVPTNGSILFPKYPTRDDGRAVAPWPNEIYRIVSPMSEHPMMRWDDPTEP